jgi:excisionase family DNA binding protein
MRSQNLPGKDLFRPEEVAAYFSVSRKTIYAWVEIGKLNGCSPNGGSLRIFRESILALMKDSQKGEED